MQCRKTAQRRQGAMEHVTVADLLKATGGVLLGGSADAPVEGHIRLDSRKAGAGDLFVALTGEHADGHNYIPQVVEAGAAAVLMSKKTGMPHEPGVSGTEACGHTPQTALILVHDTREALQDIGRYLRRRLTLPLVGVTGSVGKTTTREIIAAALSARYRTFKTAANLNSQVGVPVTISEISQADEIGVIELGMSEPGEMTVIAQIAQIDMAVITNIGITHIEQLGSRENIYREKMAIQDGLKKNGILILNGDDDLLRNARGKEGVRTVYYGTGEHCDYRAEEITLSGGRPEFTVVCEKGGRRIRLNALGRHNVMNALAAIAVCLESGMTLSEAAEGILSFRGFKNRLELLEGERFTILDDTYNASPASMKAALDVLMELPGSRHIAVLADMKELGERERESHFEVGCYAAGSGVDLVAVLGPACADLAAGIREHSQIPVTEFLDKAALTAWLDTTLCDGDCILFKGSNSIRLFEISARYLAMAGQGGR